MCDSATSKDLSELRKAEGLKLDDEVLLCFEPNRFREYQAFIDQLDSIQDDEASASTIPGTIPCWFVSNLRDYVHVLLASRSLTGSVSEATDQPSAPDGTMTMPMASADAPVCSKDGTFSIISTDPNLIGRFRARHGRGFGPMDFFDVSKLYQVRPDVRIIDDLVGYAYCEYVDVEIQTDSAQEITLEGARLFGRAVRDWGFRNTSLNGLKEISKACLEALIADGDGELELNGIEYLDVESAGILKKLQNLHLKGLRQITSESAIELASGQICILYLDGLEDLGCDAAKALFTKCEVVTVGGIEKISDDFATAISELNSKEFHLFGVKTLEPETAAKICSAENMLNLSGLITVSDEVAEIFQSSKAVLNLGGLKNISADVHPNSPNC